MDQQSGGRLDTLTTMLAARNLIVHGIADVSELGAGGGALTVAQVGEWRRLLNQLADTLDEVVRRHVRVGYRIDVSWSDLEARP